MSTIFSQIVEGEIPARVVYEDETTIAFLDANPLAPGHTLVIPKDEYERLNDVPDDVAPDLYAAIHQLVPAVEDAVDADASTVAFNNGAEAGQEVPHVHCHIVPRFDDDRAGPIHGMFAETGSIDSESLEDIATDLSETELDDIADGIESRV
ncbi:HIT family protein [Natronolimnohabitans innermongolicus]|uniref:Histidine triad (HIT) protein n=1 Tax=Natronolimnohabitans innermongolicus JCM 12255 TaxID=1227499 RepID=L9X0C6_9EURY|nr:HIT family protein [Natronolimnohabitans innermongolicus]ELY54901.1 histidine triad (HIT) protein [Natronolimnohabitans innermongolicus JCM 12255]